MLSELQIQNFAIIESAALTFGPGLNVISGETGAGKSIILQALEFILGGKGRPESIRRGCESCEVRALFDLSSAPAALRSELPEGIDGSDLLLSRALSREGRGKVYINGKLSSLAVLQEASQKLVNICRQGQYVRLLEPKYHLELIDGFAGHGALLAKYRQCFRGWTEARDRLETIRRQSEQGAARRAEIAEMLSELEPVAPRPGIRAELEAEVRRLANAELILEKGSALAGALGSDDGLFDIVRSLASLAAELERLDPRAEDALAGLQRGQAEFEELERSLGAYLSGIEVGEEELSVLRERLAEIARLERKYRCGDGELAEMLERGRAEVALLNDSANLRLLQEEMERQFAALEEAGEELSAGRRQAAILLGRSVGAELRELNMPDAVLEAQFVEGGYAENGKDRVELLLAPNRGEGAKPLRQIASGGELSRVMLVLKKVLKERTGVNVLVFDEVDAGVSGGVARAVGLKLKSLAGHSQVLCITHLAQIASLSDHHFLAEKMVGNRTVSQIREISGEEKVDEIARMLAGYTITAASRASARELLSSN